MSAKADIYCKGVILSELSNIERISEEMTSDYHQMQHFITESPWDARELMDKVSGTVSSLLPKRKLTGLLIDETGIEKKGEKSVGVGWQYCGNAGKVCNSQVSVLGCLSNGDFASPVDARLYLPEDWTDDLVRCDKAGIPENGLQFRTKPELAFEIVRHQTELDTAFDFVGGDGLYGNDVKLTEGIAALGKVYMLDIHSDQLVFTERPQLEIPPKKGKKGRTPTKVKPDIDSTKVNRYMENLPPEAWMQLTVRNTAKGKLRGDYHFKRVYIWDKPTGQILSRLLVIRRTKTGKGEFEYKYSFTNANLGQYTREALAYMQAQRFFVEYCIKESKQILGLDQFQTRKWSAWQHQVALNFLVSSFILKEKLENFDDIPLLSARDIKEMLVFKIYRQMTESQMCERMFIRHVKRQRDINIAYGKQEI